MKKLLLILFLFTGYTSFSQGKIGGEGNVIPTGNYPIVASKDIKGGLHKFQTIAERNALPANYRDTGMLAYVVDSLKFYYLKDGIGNSNWQELTLKSAGGYFATNHPYPVQTIVEMLALDTAKVGDIAIVADSSKSYILSEIPSSVQANWLELLSPVLANTDYLPEGSTHLYSTTQRIRNAISADWGITYDNTTGKIKADSSALKDIFYNKDSIDAKISRIETGSGGGTGSVTSVAKGYGILQDGTITTTGTITVDSAALASKFKRITDSVDVSFLKGGKIRDSLLPVSNIYIQQAGAGETHIVRAANDTTLSVATLKNTDDITISKASDSSVLFQFTHPHYTKDQVDSIAATLTTSGGGAGGISQLGSPAYGLIKINDSTYIADTSVLAGLYLRIKDSTIVFATPQQVHDSILSNKVTVIAKSPVVIYKKMGGDLYDSIGIRQASSTDSGYLSKEDWNRFNRNSKDTSRIIRKDSLGITPNTNFPFSSYIGLVLANYYQSVGSGTESSPAISMRGGWTHAVTGYHPAWIQMYAAGSSAGGILNIRASEDSSSWTSLLTMNLGSATFTPPVFSQSFTASTGISVTNLLNTNQGHHSILFGAGSGNYANPFSLVEIKDTTTGFIINRGSTLARLKLGTSPFRATVISGGSGYTGTIFNNISISGGSGTGTAGVGGTISGGVVTSITAFNPNQGSGYRIGDTISAAIPGGTGFSAVITKLQGDTACGLQFYDTTLNRLYVWNCTNHYWDAIGPNQHSILTPTTGSTINVVRDLDYIINPAGTIAELTIALPSTPNNNDKVYLKFSQAVTTITYSGGTVVGIPTTATAGQQFYLTYDLTTNTWY